MINDYKVRLMYGSIVSEYYTWTSKNITKAKCEVVYSILDTYRDLHSLAVL